MCSPDLQKEDNIIYSYVVATETGWKATKCVEAYLLCSMSSTTILVLW